MSDDDEPTHGQPELPADIVPYGSFSCGHCGSLDFNIGVNTEYEISIIRCLGENCGLCYMITKGAPDKPPLNIDTLIN